MLRRRPRSDLAWQQELLAENAASKALIASLNQQVAGLTEQVASLKQQLAQQQPSPISVMPAEAAAAAAAPSEDEALRERLEQVRTTLAGALQGLATDDVEHLPAPALQLVQTRHAPSRRAAAAGRADVPRMEAELRCLLASMRHADRELRTARSAIADGPQAAPPERLRRSRSLDREELQAQLVQTKLRAAQLEMERDEHLMAVRRLRATATQPALAAVKFKRKVQSARDARAQAADEDAPAP